MRLSISSLLYLAAFVCFVMAAFGASVGRVNLIGLGLALWLAADHLLSAVGL
jgi:hypothetical protein